jgi:hypothetical protein
LPAEARQSEGGSLITAAREGQKKEKNGGNMPNMITAKIWDINHSKGFFKIHVRKLDDGQYFASVLYYDRREMHEGDDREPVELKMEAFIETSEERGYQRCIDWIDKNLGTGFKVTPLSSDQ